MVTFEEMKKAEGKFVRLTFVDGKVLKGYCSYVMPKSPGEDEDNSIFIDTDIKYIIEQKEIEKLEILNGNPMKTIYKEDLQLDVLDSVYTMRPIILYLNNGRVERTQIDYYTHEEEPFNQYIAINWNFEDDTAEYINFNDILKIELLDEEEPKQTTTTGKNKVLAFAKELDNNFEIIKYLGQWKNYKVYDPLYKNEKPINSESPLLILEDQDGKLKSTKANESLNIMDELYNKGYEKRRR